MESLRHQLLQAELTRIEQEAEAKSYAIMNKIDTLVAAALLCAKVNEDQNYATPFYPVVTHHHDTSCEVQIFTFGKGGVLLSRLNELGLQWNETRPFGDDQCWIEIEGVRGVSVAVNNHYVSGSALKAAA